MNVFVTGGTRVLGQPVVRTLVERGHAVRALSRSADSDQMLKELGAVPTRADLFDPASLREAMGNADAVLHLATRIPPANEMRRAEAWSENDRIRAEGTRNLVEVALGAGAMVLIYPSITFIYPDKGADWIDAATTKPAAVGPTVTTLQAEDAVARFAGSGGRGVSLRLGTLYGPASSHTQGTLAYARKGIAGIVGRDDAYQSSIWADDAASAIVAAMEHAPSGIYDVVDNEPLRRQDLVTAIAESVGRKRLWRMPGMVTRRLIGNSLYDALGRSQRVSNRRFNEATGWSPAVPNARVGWRILGTEEERAAAGQLETATR
jgi:nucleoside-diphosphate-sugar epimerase